MQQKYYKLIARGGVRDAVEGGGIYRGKLQPWHRQKERGERGERERETERAQESES